MPADQSAVVDYVPRDDYDTQVLESMTAALVEATGFRRLPRRNDHIGLVCMAISLVKPLRWLARIGARRRNLLAVVTRGPSYVAYNASYFLRNKGTHAVYLMDAWPHRFQRIVQFARALGLKTVFISYRDSAHALQRMAPDIDWKWIPEGLAPDDYRQKPYAEREVDLFTFGRKYIPYHTPLAQGHHAAGINYLFNDEGVMVAATHEDFLNTLANSKITICTPRSVTHPDLTQGVDAITMRFLQSMASKCLIVGKAPQDMLDLFGYNPVVDADLSDPVAQIRHILDHFDEYIPLIERNYETVYSSHLWSHRLQMMDAHLAERYGWHILRKHV